MTRPTLPPVPDVIPFEDEPARQVLREWAEAHAHACTQNALARFVELLLSKGGVTASVEVVKENQG